MNRPPGPVQTVVCAAMRGRSSCDPGHRRDTARQAQVQRAGRDPCRGTRPPDPPPRDMASVGAALRNRHGLWASGVVEAASMATGVAIPSAFFDPVVHRHCGRPRPVDAGRRSGRGAHMQFGGARSGRVEPYRRPTAARPPRVGDPWPRADALAPPCRRRERGMTALRTGRSRGASRATTSASAPQKAYARRTASAWRCPTRGCVAIIGRTATGIGPRIPTSEHLRTQLEVTVRAGGQRRARAGRDRTTPGPGIGARASSNGRSGVACWGRGRAVAASRRLVLRTGRRRPRRPRPSLRSSRGRGCARAPGAPGRRPRSDRPNSRCRRRPEASPPAPRRASGP